MSHHRKNNKSRHTTGRTKFKFIFLFVFCYNFINIGTGHTIKQRVTESHIIFINLQFFFPPINAHCTYNPQGYAKSYTCVYCEMCSFSFNLFLFHHSVLALLFAFYLFRFGIFENERNLQRFVLMPKKSTV